MSEPRKRPEVVVIGGGFTGLSAAFELSRLGIRPIVLEEDRQIGGLAGSFRINDASVEKFYHHWFTNDVDAFRLLRDLGAEDRLVYRPSRTGLYYGGGIFALSSPWDLLRFAPLRFRDRLRLGRLVLKARKITDWRALESLTAEEWLLKLCGPEVYKVVWAPLLRGKFGPYASEVSAVWFWNKLKLRGGSRGRGAKEVLAYVRGGFGAVAELLASAIESAGGKVLTGSPATGLDVADGRIRAVLTPQGAVAADAAIATPALPIVADLLQPHAPGRYLDQLRRIDYLANVCLVLEMDRSLSPIYWLNVNDGDFPFVGVIEHTNLEPNETYGGRHITYLSKYLPHTAELYAMSEQQVLDYCLPHLQRMFPRFDRSWVRRHHVWRARYAQPVVVRRYGDMIPPAATPVPGLYLASMAQIYPEDRGTNYAIRDGRAVARVVAAELAARRHP